MKFITEDDLRTLFKQAPLECYQLKPGERLTPGARQFLIDRGVDMYAADARPKARATAKTPALLALRLEGLRLECLLAAESLLATDAALANALTDLSRQLALLPLALDGTCALADLCIQPCAEGAATGDCIDVSAGWLALDNGRTLLTLAQLRNRVALLAAEDHGLAEGQRALLADKLGQIAARLSQLLCHASGGESCPTQH
ncbi:MAG: hypothetical protein Q4C56_01930 [Peptococcaceae bacterium]|nr:hypothetical protein [Peptococcaceae bacterium]